MDSLVNDNNHPQDTLDTASLLNSITATLSLNVADIDAPALFEKLLSGILSLTQGEYGFIGQLVEEDEGPPSLLCRAITNIAWNDEMLHVYKELKKGTLRFNKIDSLYGAVIDTKKPVVSNNPVSDSRFNGVPEGHPPMNSFLGLPIIYSGEFLGVVGVANRKQGFDDQIINYLQPFLAVCGTLIDILVKNTRLEEAERELNKYKSQGVDSGIVNLGEGYIFNIVTNKAMHGSDLVELTRHENKLLSLLANQANKVVGTELIENTIWKNGATGSSSVRSLLFRLRKKMPTLNVKTVSGVGYILQI